MKYKLLALAPILLLATPPAVFSQEMSPLVIETGNPVPSAVRTGEPFKVTYRAKFYDQVLIRDDQMQPENIEADPFEVIKLEIVPGPPPTPEDYELGLIHTLDFVYTFRIIKPEKGDKKIPPFKFVWLIKKAGTTEDAAKDESELREMVTDEVGVRYVTTPVKPPNLNIRDEIIFEPFSKTGAQFRNYAYWTIGFFLLLSLETTRRFYRKPNLKKVSENKKENMTGDVVAEVADDILPKKARKKFLKELDELLKGQDVNTPSPELESRVYHLLRGFILVELKGEPIKVLKSDTPRQISKRLDSLTLEQKTAMGPNHRAFSILTGKLVGYYGDMESGEMENFKLPGFEIESLKVIVRDLYGKKRFWDSIFDFFRVPHA